MASGWARGGVRGVCDRTGLPTDPGWGTGKLVLELYEKHAEHRIAGPTFVTDYPVEVSPLAHPHRDDPFVTERFELIIGGREFANCFSELTDPDEQRARMEEQALAKAAGDEDAMVVDEAYLRALELGLPPNAGLGAGGTPRVHAAGRPVLDPRGVAVPPAPAGGAVTARQVPPATADEAETNSGTGAVAEAVSGEKQSVPGPPATPVRDVGGPGV